ncbi:MULTISPECIES: glyoxalase superfamily protein [Mumia]|uniref:glyoxalase superfamily protein n=1 Tax=Mumia TaxID=1546255 RepID=UPI00141DF9F7|nr:glyoxalase superfamily protein [Mumia sp. ZJ1417]QMW67845.1 VOC family protein [Mumia sp. ZJ1417]
MDWKLENIILGVTDVDRAKEFYADRVGFHLDVDHQPNDHFRVVQLTPVGSACSITFGVGLGGAAPGATKGIHLVVDDIEAAHADLESRGVENTGIQNFAQGAPTPGVDPQRRDFMSYVYFDDPDGNSWVVQEAHHASGTT